jgi:hypothetical protein
MENAPVINLRFTDFVPGADADAWERYKKWRAEVYSPMLVMKSPGVTGNDLYQIVRETPEYPSNGGITHRDSLSSWNIATGTTEVLGTQSEYIEWERRGVIECIRSPVYSLIKGFRSGQLLSWQKPDTRIENAPIMHLQAYCLSREEPDKYGNWFSEYGCKIFIPLFIKLPGLKGYDWFKYTGLMRSSEVRDHDYPLYLSIIYFDTIQSYYDYHKSPEQIAFQKALRMVFPRGLKYEWYVLYELTNSWRK